MRLRFENGSGKVWIGVTEDVNAADLRVLWAMAEGVRARGGMVFQEEDNLTSRGWWPDMAEVGLA
jgi:hypothetical protein